MKVNVKFYGNLRTLANRSETEVVLEDSSTVVDALDLVASTCCELRKQIFDENGILQRFILVIRNGRQVVSQDAMCENLVDGDTLDLLPPVRGG